MLDDLREPLAAGGRVVLDLVLDEDPPRPVLAYRDALEQDGADVVVRLLRTDVPELLRRIRERGRPGDDRPGLRADVVRQLAVLASPHLEPGWVLDTTGLDVEQVVAACLVASGDAGIDAAGTGI